ncbi:MAG: PD40 domain-containing protein [Planctomycetia bacterium]|nr:PD40 domain-containing protein [Planctomycetia bacterium]
MRTAPPLCLLAALVGCNLPDPDLRPAPPRRAAFGEAQRTMASAVSGPMTVGGDRCAWPDPTGVLLETFRPDMRGLCTTDSPLTITGARDPALSSDGTLLAVVRPDGAVYAFQPAKDGPELLVSRPAVGADHPCFSPDAGSVVWQESSAARLWITELSSSRETCLGEGALPSWSPDGAWIAFESDHSLWKVRPDGSDRTRLTEGRDARRPTWSPDSRWIAFGQFDGDGRADDIWAVRSDGSRFLRVTWDPAPEWDPCWAPDGRIFFTTVRNGDQGIWVVAPENSELLK